jgi:hypothetical protein
MERPLPACSDQFFFPCLSAFMSHSLKSFYSANVRKACTRESCNGTFLSSNNSRYLPYFPPTVFFLIYFEARAPVDTIITFSISTDKTVIWYDHWEDGYDLSVVSGASPKTEVWGDGDASNGCAPDVKVCVNNNDYLMAGRSIVIQNKVELPRNKDHIRYDGGDIIHASYPIAVIRAGFPTYPGSEMAGSGTLVYLLLGLSLCAHQHSSLVSLWQTIDSGGVGD